VRKAVSESRIFISADLLKEYRDVPSALASQGKITVEQFNTLIAGIAAVVATASMVRPRKRVKVCRDSSDDMLLECCLATEAEYLVTGDKDLLSLKTLPFPLKIVTPREYVQRARK
jgi:putative PIN family toxin of toxin-antitoxin system